MTVSIAPALLARRLQATLAAFGPGARVRIYGGARPAAGAEAATPPLAELLLADPPGVLAEDKISLAPLDPAGVLIARSGQATWARITNSAGVALIDCDVSGPSGAGDWKIDIDGLPAGAAETQMYEGGTFILGTVTLA